MVESVRAEGSGSIAIGGDAINSIFVTGGVNQFFLGQYERLADAYISPRSLYRELGLDGFCGREWLLRHVDDFLARHDRGYVVIEAEAGMGKTAFMAWLARHRHYVHHFVRLMQDPRDVGAALRSLAAQLIRAWDLEHHAVGGVLPARVSRPDFFVDLLYEAAERRDATRPGEPIVLAIDGVDESAAPPGQNPLALPADLPDGVFIVVSQRTTHVPLVVTTPREILRLSPRSPENLADVQLFLDRALAEPRLRDRLQREGIDPGDLARRLSAWSGGVWLVLRYVLAELRSGSRVATDLESLPSELWRYYARFWLDWQDDHGTSWASADLPLLVTLAAAQEPLSLPVLQELSGVADAAHLARLVEDDWRPFLEVVEGSSEESYRIFHQTLVEFVAGAVRRDSLSSAERALVKRLEQELRAAHGRIARRYLSAWGGADGALPGLDTESALLDGGYGLRQLIVHLVAGSEDALVHHVMRLERPSDLPDPEGVPLAVNTWYDVHQARRELAGYALDVERAWVCAERSATGGPTPPRAVSLECRYALMSASVNSVTGNVPGELLGLLVDHGVLTASRAYDLAREAPGALARAEGLAALLPRLAGVERSEAEATALASALAVPDGYWRAGELVMLVPLVSQENLGVVERLAERLHEPYYRRIVREAVSLRREGHPVLGAGVARDGVDSLDPDDPRVFAAQYRERSARAVATLLMGSRSTAVPDVPTPVRQLASTSTIRDPRWRAQALVALSRDVSRRDQDELLKAALAVALGIGDDDEVAAGVHAVSVAVAAVADLATALECLAGLHGAERRARALFAVADVVAPAERPQAVAAALHSAYQVEDPEARSELLGENAHLLGDESRPQGVARTGAGADPVGAITHPTWLAGALADAGDWVGALRVVDDVQGREARAVTLLRLADRIATSAVPAPVDRDVVEEARVACLEVVDWRTRARLAGGVASALAGVGRWQAALDLVEELPADERAIALRPWAARVPPLLVARALALVTEIPAAGDRGRLLAALTASVAAGTALGPPLSLDVPDVQEHLRGALHLLATGTRSDLLRALPDLVPGIAAVGGYGALAELVEAVWTVQRWWP